MEKGWVKIVDSEDLIRLQIYAAKMENEEIETILLNKIDSMNSHIGWAELWVREEKAVIAKYVMERIDSETL